MTVYFVSLADGRYGCFSSVAAIYTVFSKQDIGCAKEALWKKGIRKHGVHFTKNATIKTYPVISTTKRK